MTEETDDSTIYGYGSHNFDMVIGETMNYLTCHKNKSPKVLKYDSVILPFGEISHKKKKLRPISHERY